MPRWGTWLVLVALVAITQSGCGTVVNLLSDDPQVYGGVAKVPQIYAEVSDCDQTTLCVLAADLALTIVGDTLTLPLAIALRQNPKEHSSRHFLPPPTPAPDQQEAVPPATITEGGQKTNPHQLECKAMEHGCQNP